MCKGCLRLYRHTAVASLGVAVLLLVTGCGKPVPPPLPDGSTWLLERIETPEDTLIAEGFDDDPKLYFSGETNADTLASKRLSGYTGCNALHGVYEVSAEAQIRLGNFATTRQYCDGEPGRLEAALLEYLPNVSTYALEQNRLQLRFEGGAFYFVAN